MKERAQDSTLVPSFYCACAKLPSCQLEEPTNDSGRNNATLVSLSAVSVLSERSRRLSRACFDFVPIEKHPDFAQHDSSALSKLMMILDGVKTFTSGRTP